MDPLRRLISILLLAVFGLPFALPMLAMGQDAEAGMPACCRRSGKPHCMMRMDRRYTLVTNEPQFKAPPEKCPYCPAPGAISYPHPLATPAAQKIYADLVSYPTLSPRMESKRRIARERSRHKRGPPAQTLI